MGTQLLDDLRILAPGLTNIRIPLDLARLLPAGVQRVFVQLPLLPKPEIENYNAVVSRYRELSEMDLRVVMLEADDIGVGIREVVDRYT